MGLFGGRRAANVQTGAPEWVRRLLLEDQEPEQGTDEHEAYLVAAFLSGPDGLRQLWLRHEVELVGLWSRAHPGTRPAAWWRWSAPEGRRQVAGEPIERGAYHDQVDEAGLPLALELVPASRQVRFESEAGLLRRLGLLLEGEAGRVKRGAFADVEEPGR